MSGILIALSGLPGVGKTSIGRSVASRLDAVYLRADTAEATIDTAALKIADYARPSPALV